MGHIFPFSPKNGTPAARMPLVPPPVAKLRARRLREACARRRAGWLEGMVGTRQRVLVERNGVGHAENFAPVRIRHSSFRWNDGDVVDVRVTGIDNDMLIGVPA
jgi:threonylcarbamoyladenosine tRNA methylthiotransferase MtaB